MWSPDGACSAVHWFTHSALSKVIRLPSVQRFRPGSFSLKIGLNLFCAVALLIHVIVNCSLCSHFETAISFFRPSRCWPASFQRLPFIIFASLLLPPNYLRILYPWRSSSTPLRLFCRFCSCSAVGDPQFLLCLCHRPRVLTPLCY